MQSSEVLCVHALGPHDRYDTDFQIEISRRQVLESKAFKPSDPGDNRTQSLRSKTYDSTLPLQHHHSHALLRRQHGLPHAPTDPVLLLHPIPFAIAFAAITPAAATPRSPPLVVAQPPHLPIPRFISNTIANNTEGVRLSTVGVSECFCHSSQQWRFNVQERIKA